jgi:uncharacterized protein
MPERTETMALEEVKAKSEEFQKLDARAVRFWRANGLISAAILLPIALVGGVILWTLTEVPAFVILPAWILLALLLFIETFVLPAKRYETTSYHLGNRFFELRSGILWKTSVMIPLSRLQHVDLLRGPLEQRFGLATLQLFTAGTRNASHKLSGLSADTGANLRQQMMTAAELDSDEIDKDAE